MVAKQNFNTKFKQKIKFLRMKIMCLRVSYEIKYEKNNFFAYLKSLKKGFDPEFDPDPDTFRSADLDPHLNVTYSQHWLQDFSSFSWET